MMENVRRSALFGQAWIHVFEEDSAQGAVYRPEAHDIPLSRRPRERLEFSEDGSARLLVPGPDDRAQEQAANWSEEDGAIVIRAAAHGPAPGRVLRVVERSADRLVVQN
ncbi:MAG: hypothetical protein ACRENP_17265 [Longimicrobiales bacterium]